jgi:Mlc titration factor MtfA (ptsG expression regulator)
VIGWWQRWRRARTLERRAIPDPLWELTLARFPFLAARSQAQVEALREMATLFLAEKEFTGSRGLVVSDEMAVAIAAQACLPVLALGLERLDGFVGIVVHEDAVVARREVEDDDGIVHAYDEELSGEAMSGGPVMLAWRDVDDAGESAVDGYNVVVHEFAHVIDMRGGVTAGVETADPASERGRWLNALADDYERFADRVDHDEETFLDPYAAEALEEFFAVGAEAFFVAPEDLQREEPELYRLLAEFFRQDPARDKRNAGREAPASADASDG